MGAENVSAVSLEQFNPIRTFPLAALVNKLANIAEELGEIDKSAEGLLKQIVTGGLVTIERKHKDAFEFVPTARLTFATNVLPKFRDRSSGLWRRLLLIGFPNQILDESKQDKNLASPDWWASTGELSGIFNWALEGLLRLIQRDRFVEPQECVALKNDYRNESNSALMFLLESCALKDGKTIASNKLYATYRVWVEQSGGAGLAQILFTKEVKKAFSGIYLTENPQRQPGGTRSRDWLGLDWTDGAPS